MIRTHYTLTGLLLGLWMLFQLPTVSASAASAAAELTVPPLLSPGLCVIAGRDCELLTSTYPGGEVQFTDEDFRSVSGTGVGSVTVLSGPDPALGQLAVGALLLPAGQRVTGPNLCRMSFVPSDEAKAGDEAVFTYRCNDSPYVFTCRVLIADEQTVLSNARPSADCAAAASLRGTAYCGCVYAGTLGGRDPDGDALTFSVVRYPSHGSLLLGADGSYRYRPDDGFTGRDAFSYSVRDCWGSRAETDTEVRLTVTRCPSAAVYSDLKNDGALCTALTVTAAGLMNGTRIGEDVYFCPDAAVSRSEFLVSLMTAAGISDLPDPGKTVFADDGDIPDGMRPYVAAAYTLGWTDGWIVDGKQCFLPAQPITAAEAAVMTASVLGLPADGAVKVSLSPEDGPSWAREAMAALSRSGIPVGTDGSCAAPGASVPLDRLTAARLLCAVLRARAASVK